MSEDPTRAQIKKAFAIFAASGIPSGYRAASTGFVIDPERTQLCPVKVIYGLAKGIESGGDFNTREARKSLKRLGFTVLETGEALEAGEAFANLVKQSLQISNEERAARLAAAPRKPILTVAAIVRYGRNPDVVAQRLIMAAGSCEACGKPAPFKRKRDRTPYLEVHHVMPLSEGGDDTVENTRALCPNCHRRAHFG